VLRTLAKPGGETPGLAGGASSRRDRDLFQLVDDSARHCRALWVVARYAKSFRALLA